MTVPSIDVAQMGAMAQPTRTPKQTMDSEVFMHLLVTQLSNQDPSSPMDTNEMIGQSTQLASMERLNALSATQNAALDVQQRTAAAALVGREAATGGTDAISGVVTAVSFAGGEPMVTIGELQVPYSHIVSIRQATAVPPSAAGAPAAEAAAIGGPNLGGPNLGGPNPGGPTLGGPVPAATTAPTGPQAAASPEAAG